MSRCLLTTTVLACLTAAAQAGQPKFVAEIDGRQSGAYIRPFVVLTGPLQGMEHRVERADGFVCPDAFVIGRSDTMTLLYVGGEPVGRYAQIAPVFTVGDRVVSVDVEGKQEGRIDEVEGKYIKHDASHRSGAALLGVADFMVGLGVGDKTVHCRAILDFLDSPELPGD